MTKANLLNKQIGSHFWLILLAGVCALGIYALIILLPIPAVIGLFVRYNLIILSLITLPIFYYVFKLKGFSGIFAGMGMTLILFGLPLSGLWRSGASEPFIIGGLLPFSDTSSYYTDALRVVEGYRFSAFSARRPLFPALLTVLLAITNQNLMVSIAVLSTLIALACYLAAREMQRSFGTLPAVVFLFVLFLFYRRISGTTLTENLGLPLGISAFVILWSAARNKKLWQTVIGLLLLTLALNARAGTFFILPALIVWAGFAFREQRRFSVAAALISTAAVACGFLLNMLVFKLIADPGGMVFSNFSYTLYGVVAGGKGWMQILIDHPELAQLDDVSRSAQTYALVFETWKAHPFNIVVGALKNWFDYLMPRGAGAFGFVRGEEAVNWINYAVRIVLSLLAGWGLVNAWKQRKTEPFGMMLWAAAGIFLSVPFVPPNDSNQMRVYAATVTFLICFCVIGLKSLIDLFLHKPADHFDCAESNGKPALAFGVTLSLITICGVLLVKAFSQPQELPQGECLAGETQFISRFSAYSLVSVNGVLGNQINVPLTSFVELNEGYPEMHAALVNVVGDGAVMGRSFDLLSMKYPLLIMDSGMLPASTGIMNICAVPATGDELERYDWWQVSSINLLND